MASFSTAMVIFAAVMTAMVLVSLPEVKAQNPPSCVSKLVPCFSALTTTTKPPKDCCDSIKEAVEKELTCLCNVYNTPGLLSSFNVTTAQALNLTTRCDVTTDLSACSGAASPKASLPPPAAAGNRRNDTSAGIKLAGGYGVTTVIFSLVSTIFF